VKLLVHLRHFWGAGETFGTPGTLLEAGETFRAHFGIGQDFCCTLYTFGGSGETFGALWTHFWGACENFGALGYAFWGG
jgi:hypothetical protein